jgi:hypothetical protein
VASAATPAPAKTITTVTSTMDFKTFMQKFLDMQKGWGAAGQYSKARSMLRSERFQLFSEVTPDFMDGIVRSQSSGSRLYSCRLNRDGTFNCSTQNSRICGALPGQGMCKHVMVMVLGLVNTKQADPESTLGWIKLSATKRGTMNKEEAAKQFVRYAGAEAGTVDWRPTETIPEDFYAF